MSEEPTYTYIKGQGWVPAIHESEIITDGAGKRWLMTKRAPVLGELWDGTHEANRTMAQWIDKYRYSRVVICPIFGRGDTNPGDWDNVVTFTPL